MWKWNRFWCNKSLRAWINHTCQWSLLMRIHLTFPVTEIRKRKLVWNCLHLLWDPWLKPDQGAFFPPLNRTRKLSELWNFFNNDVSSDTFMDPPHPQCQSRWKIFCYKLGVSISVLVQQFKGLHVCSWAVLRGLLQPRVHSKVILKGSLHQSLFTVFGFAAAYVKDPA